MEKDKYARVTMNISVAAEFKERVTKKAREMGIPASALVVVGVNDYLKQDSVLDMSDMFRQLQAAGFAPDPAPVPAIADRPEPEQARASWQNESKHKKRK